MSETASPRDEAAAALGAREQLGPEYEPAVAESFADRIEQIIDARVAEQVARASAAEPAKPDNTARDHALALAIVSLVLAVPLTAIAAHTADLIGMILVWAGLVVINVARSWATRR